MKREIKFRGFERSTGKWRYGHFSQGHTEWYIKSEKEGVWEVPYDSVGQFTGLHDKNCIEIYEGDICQFTRVQERIDSIFTDRVIENKEAEKYTGQVVFEEGSFMLRNVNAYNVKPSLSNWSKRYDNGKVIIDHQLSVRKDYTATTETHYNSFEVIGNIYEHPHLLTPHNIKQ